MTKTKKAAKQITIIGKRWFDKVNGNTYHSFRIFIDNALVKTQGMTYGYGDQFEQNAILWLKENGHVDKKLMRFEVREKHSLLVEVSDGLKRELDKA